MSAEATPTTVSAASNRRSYRCYNCNHAFHITTTTSAARSSFRCPRCFHRHLLPNYTIATFTPPPQSPNSNSTPPTASATNSVTTFYSSDSDSDWTDNNSDDFSFELTQFRSPTLKSFLGSLPSVKIIESLKSCCCSICMEEFEVDSEASELPCKHFFHNDCIVPWLNRSNTCPLCRHKLPREDQEEIDRETEENRVVLQFVHSLESREVSDDDDDAEFRGWDLEEMHDEDGDTLMVDA
ncbi:probable E3 ubiquitin-protein ligase RHC2A [Nicotiana tomentosiformis]|uniref:probable E3 ubiquitin-protein ligase RHC2A n=1 Tax=Nicotiana tomentosiformis TaxID=4098 RepID=UPI00051ADAEE|nr:probable E3 ubiquitin-protein ligase RHC2A [Nicotiana tomentosiformis]